MNDSLSDNDFSDVPSLVISRFVTSLRDHPLSTHIADNFAEILVELNSLSESSLRTKLEAEISKSQE